MSQQEQCKKRLLQDGWDLTAPYSFRKGEYEVVFDTSHWAELYRDDHSRLADISLMDSQIFWNTMQSHLTKA